jgi:hypothetical protein
MTYEDVVSDYIRDIRDAARAEMRLFKNQPSLAEAISNAVRPGGRKHRHQYRIPSRSLDETERRLTEIAAALLQAPDFTALHQTVEGTIRPIRGIGKLTVYDIAHRLGAFLGKAPTLVYLHTGTKTGAAALGLRGETIRPDMLPAAFSRLSAAEIEDCLCIYNNRLRGHEIRPGHFQHLNHCKEIDFPRAWKCRFLPRRKVLSLQTLERRGDDPHN